MQKYVTALAVAAIAAVPALAFGDQLKSGDRVEAAAAFFMCGAREDLATMVALARQGDRQTAIKVGTERCESGHPGYKYLVVQDDGDAVCIRGGNIPYCLWAQRSSLQLTPSQ